MMHHLVLLNYGFRFFETRPLYQANQSLTKIRAWKGEPSDLQLGLAESLAVTFPKGKYEQLNASLDRPTSLEAPVNKGQSIGKVVVTLDGNTIVERPLIALTEIKEASLWRRLLDTGLQYFE